MEITSRSAQLIAYETIREKIINGAFPGGMKLVEVQLAEEIGVSRTPIREAIRRLEQEGLIKRKKVIKPSEKDLRHMFQMRTLIESHAAKMAATYMSEKRIVQLRSSIHLAQRSNTEGTVKANKEFHDLIVQECRNPIMIETVDKMQSIIYLFSKTVVVHERPLLLEEHMKICDAIEQRKPELASSLMEEHLKADLEFTLNIVE
ncbi:GntR family transcriptional regulator [Mammaliicoccus sciuri]|uniref:DNA-binding transcriptional regulator, GntR family n=1 Tax=Sporosarcina newyorkensis TaxID=759851 RepID=A0A1T4YU75_9BACL|nr:MULTISPECIES: GntR family transcriptional regulator [Sporosarcina]MBY0223570.1 GntR family transcriptional regulator [Sporosarcina aquimarina]SKB05349.1 DNA-binding transcriptional regulator, GntR family [Sporosarcina newyorkensis]